MRPEKGDALLFQGGDRGGAGQSLTIATTRPETIPATQRSPSIPTMGAMPGSSACMPYARCRRSCPPEQKLIPIIGDAHVEFEFGTGVLKVTPAHDKADFEIGQRHALPVVDIMNPDGVMNDLAGEDLAGLDRFEAREAAIRKLEQLGAHGEAGAVRAQRRLLRAHERACRAPAQRPMVPQLPAVPQSTPPCAPAQSPSARSAGQRCTTIGWAISRTGASPASSGGAIAFPSGTRRQNPSSAPYVGVEPPTDAETGSRTRTCSIHGSPPGSGPSRRWTRRRAPSSIPTTDLVTGPDIIFFWVARMIMAGFEFTGTRALRECLLHRPDPRRLRAARCQSRSAIPPIRSI